MEAFIREWEFYSLLNGKHLGNLRKKHRVLIEGSENL